MNCGESNTGLSSVTQVRGKGREEKNEGDLMHYFKGCTHFFPLIIYHYYFNLGDYCCECIAVHMSVYMCMCMSACVVARCALLRHTFTAQITCACTQSKQCNCFLFIQNNSMHWYHAGNQPP